VLESQHIAGARAPLLEAKRLHKSFPTRDGSGTTHAVSDVSLELWPGETLGIVGESGSGKSTLARLLLQLITPSSGTTHFDGRDLGRLDRKSLSALRREMQIVFQDPYASLDPRMTVGDIVAEPLAIHRLGSRADRRRKVLDCLGLVGLEPEAARRYPHEFSGGQRQRIGIARAIILEPKLVILDEPVSALDVSIQSQILNLLMVLKQRLGLSYIFISHDLSVVEHVSDRVAVMYLGRIVEMAAADALFERPLHPYTEALFSAIPGAAGHGTTRIVLRGDPPSPQHPPKGCHFHPRCPKAFGRCSAEIPEDQVFVEGGRSRMVACHLYPPARDPSRTSGGVS